AGSSPTAKHGERETALVALLSLLAVASWIALWAWSASPWAGYLVHDSWSDAGVLGALCRAIPRGDIVVPALFHALAWLLMIAAMMLPTTYPLLAMVRRVTAGRPDARWLLALVVSGFVAAWLGFGLLAHAADAALRWLAVRNGWLVGNGWI